MICSTNSLCISTLRDFIIRTHVASIISALCFCTSSSTYETGLIPPPPSIAILAADITGIKLTRILLLWNSLLRRISSLGSSNLGTLGCDFSKKEPILGSQSFIMHSLNYSSFNEVVSLICAIVSTSASLKSVKMAV